MIFKKELAEKILSGEKSQTRRLVHPEDCEEYFSIPPEYGHRLCGEIYAVVYPRISRATTCEYDAVRYAVGKTYAVCPGRGKPAIGRIRITAIEREDVRDISEEDAIAEGFRDWGTARWGFWCTWAGIYDRIAYRYMSRQGDDAILDWRPTSLYDAWKITFEAINAHE